MSIDTWDAEELAWRAMGMTDKQAEKAIDLGADVNDALLEKYDCSFESYCAIVADLIRFTPIVASALTGTRYHAFVDAERAVSILKQEAEK